MSGFLSAGIVGGPDIPDSALTQDLVAWYRFEDGDARDYASSAEFPNVTWGDSTAFDGTVNGATFQSSGGVTDFQNGANSGAFAFDGNDDEIEAPSSLNKFAGNASFTLMLWVNRDATDFTELLNTGAVENPGWRFLVSNPDLLRFDNTISDTQFKGSVVGTSVKHLAVTYNAGDVTLYQNGSVDASGNVGQFTQSSNDVLIGYYPTNIGYFDGVMDDIRVYNRELTDAEISDIYNATKP